MKIDENYYKIPDELKEEIDKTKKKYKRLDEYYAPLIYVYNLILDKTAQLFNGLDSSKDPILYSLLLNELITSGALSVENTFTLLSKDNIIKFNFEVENHFGINIILGEGCCRNFSDFHKDLFDKLNLYSKKYYCYVSSHRNLRKSIDKNANHVMNLVEKDGKVYGVDSYNYHIYNFINQIELKIVSDIAREFYIYKPLCECEYELVDEQTIKENLEQFKKYSKQPKFSYLEYSDYMAKVEQIMNKNENLIYDFKDDTLNYKILTKAIANKLQ